LALTTAETPLKGGLNTPLHSVQFSTTVDRSKNVNATPNTVLGSVLGTPRTAMGTNERFMETPGSQRQIAGSTLEGGQRMTEKLGKLPKPKNDFDLVLPEDEEDDELSANKSSDWVEDAEDVKKLRAQSLQRRQEKERLLRSHVFQRNLPLPSKLNDQYYKRSSAANTLTNADDIIKEEMVKLMEWDVSGKVPEDIYTPEQVAEAQKLIQDEVDKIPNLDANMWKVIRECSSELIKFQGRYTRLSHLGRREQAEALSNKFRVRFDWMTDLSKKTAKLEKKLKVVLGGYTGIQNTLQTKLQECIKQREKLLIELKTFQRLENNEERAIVKRVETLMKELREVQECQADLQKEYAELQQEHCELNMPFH